MLSIVIPVLNAADTLRNCLAGLDNSHLGHEEIPREILVVDGGSSDFTSVIARKANIRVLETPPGRGLQMAAGAERTSGDWLLFLHGDTVLQQGWQKPVAKFIDNPLNLRRAAVFRFALDDDRGVARFMEKAVAWRVATLDLPYGDQGLLISRAFYQELGGFAPLPLMEDVDMIRRIGRDRLAVLDCAAITSARRYEGWRAIVRPVFNLSLLGLYYLGLPPRLLAKVYG